MTNVIETSNFMRLEGGAWVRLPGTGAHVYCTGPYDFSPWHHPDRFHDCSMCAGNLSHTDDLHQTKLGVPFC